MLLGVLQQSCSQMQLRRSVAIMDSRPTKIAKLQSLRAKLPFMSQSALSAVLQVAAQEPLPIGASRADVRAARNAIASQRTPYGTVHQTIELESIKGGTISFEIQHPLSMLYHAASVSESLSKLLLRVSTSTPSSPSQPWKLALYTDEILPGSQLAYKNTRKMWGVYWSILDWGSAVLADEEHVVFFVLEI